MPRTEKNNILLPTQSCWKMLLSPLAGRRSYPLSQSIRGPPLLLPLPLLSTTLTWTPRGSFTRQPSRYRRRDAFLLRHSSSSLPGTSTSEATSSTSSIGQNVGFLPKQQALTANLNAFVLYPHRHTIETPIPHLYGCLPAEASIFRTLRSFHRIS